MSEENVEIVRRVFEAGNRGDLDALAEAYDPEVEIVTLMSGTYHGPEGARQAVEEGGRNLRGVEPRPERADRRWGFRDRNRPHTGSRAAQRNRAGGSDGSLVHDPERADHPAAELPQQGRSPRSRRA